MASLAEQKKAILPYLQRADEISTLNPKVAYYCREYAIQQGIQIQNMLPEIRGVLEAQMTRLEEDKPKLNIVSKREDGQECEAFAVTVFNRADKQDRSGKANLNTVKAFYVASVFIDILRQFDPNGELPVDMAERQQYAAWKAADIRKALREGRVPQAGPPVNDDDLGLPEIPDLKHDGTDPTPPEVATSASSGLPSLPSRPSITQRDSTAGPQNPPLPPVGAPGQASGGGMQGAPCRFRPGNKVFYNRYDGPPVKGTVVSVNTSTTYGNLYQVGLSQKVVEVPENRLAFDFADGDHVQYSPPSGHPSQGTVERSDTSRWPIAYLVSLHEQSDTVATQESALVPAEATRAASPPPAAGPHSPARSMPDAASGGLSPARADSQAGVTDLETRDSQVAGLSSSGDAQGPGDDDFGRSTSQGEALLPNGSGVLPPGTSSSIDAGSPAPPPAFGAPAPPATNQPLGASAGPPSNTSVYPPLNQGHTRQFDDFFPGSGTQGGAGLQPIPPQGPTNAGNPPPPAARGYSGLGNAPGVGRSQLPGPAPPAAAAPRQVSQQSQSILQAQMQARDAHLTPYKPPLKAITEAQKLSKHATNALSFEDVATATKLLQQALDLLQGPHS